MEPKKLSQELEGSNPILALELFVKEFESTNASLEVANLLHEVPNFDKILKLLEQEKRSIEELTVIYDALGSFLISLSEDSTYENVGLHVTRYILQKYNKHIITLLKVSNSNKSIKAGLKIITGMVVSSMAAASEVVRSLSFNRIEFTYFAKKEHEIRINFLYMILAFLSIEDEACMAQFVNYNSEIVTSVFEKLPDDPYLIIVKFLRLLRSVVMNYDIKKTTKLNIFNHKNCKFLTIFYFHNLTKDKEMPFTIEERYTLRKTLHSFMVPLCSDVNYGVIFKDSDNNAKNTATRRNEIVFRILLTIQYPWQLEEGRELIILILKACPDVVSMFSGFNKNHFNPRENYGFFCLIKLCVQFIESKSAQEYVDGFKGKYIIFDPFLSKGKIISMMEANSVILRHLGLLILNTYLKKSKEILDFLNLKHLNETDRKILKDKVCQYIEKLGFSVDKIISLMHNVVQQNNEIPTWCREECPSEFILIVDMSEYIRNYVELFGYSVVRLKFSPIKMLQSEKIFPTDDLNVKFKIILNLLKILVLAQRENNFEAFGVSLSKMQQDEDMKINETFFVYLIDLYINDSLATSDCDDSLKVDVKSICFQLLKSSVDKWGLSEYCQNYIEIWLNKTLKESKSDCSKFFAKVLSKSISNFFSYLDVMTALNYESGDLESYSQINVLDYVNQLDPSIKIEDNEDINLKSIGIPFSSLILGAIDVLKEENNPITLCYFINVMEEFIHHVDNPSVLSRYLLEKNILSDKNSYLYYWATKNPVCTAAITDENLSSYFKAIFISEVSPQLLKSSVLGDIERRVQDCFELDALCRQVFSYIQSEFKSFQNNNDKSKLKYFLKIFRELIYLTQKEPIKYVHLFEYLINHSFTIRSYQPFSSTSLVFRDIENLILKMVLENYTELHSYVKPFMEKLISDLKASTLIEDEDLYTSLLLFVNHYVKFCYHDIERIIHSLLKRNEDNLTLPFCNIMYEIFGLLKRHCSRYYHPSYDLTVEIIKKMILIAKHLKSSEIHLRLFNLLSDYASTFYKPEIAVMLTYDEAKNILRSKVTNETFNKILVHSTTDIRKKLLENLNNMKVHLSCQVPFVMSFNKENSECNSLIDTYLRRIASHIIHWALNSNSNSDVDYQNAVEYMLSKDMFELSEIATVCQKFYNEKDEIPFHVLSLKPFFDRVAKIQETNDKRTTHIDLPSHSQICFLSILLNVVSKTYGKEENEKFCEEIAETMLHLIKKVDAERLRKCFYSDQLWLSFVRKVLKEDINTCKNSSKLLEVLIHLTRIIYSKKKKRDGVVSLRVLYQMLRSHSQFIFLMLDEKPKKLKEQIALLQLTIVELSSDICEERHVPVLLGAYGASRSLCDQYILKTLYLYEKEGFMPTLDPTLWGPAAVSHFAVEDNSENSSISIHYQAPRVKQIFSLIDYEKVIETALDFDMTLGLEPVEVIEQNKITLYDQRFLLSMFLHFTQVDHTLNMIDFMEKGVLALGIAALSSHREEVWKAGAAILRYIVSSFESSKSRNLKLHWIWLVAVLGYGLNGKYQRVPSIITHFLIRTSQLLLSPQEILYWPVINYLFLRPVLDLHQVPELNRLFVSSDVQYSKDHRMFLLEYLSSGIRDELDIQILKSSFFPKQLLSAIKSPCYNSYLRVQGLKVLNSMVKIPSGVWTLVQNGLLEDLAKSLKPHTTCPSYRQRLWIDLVVDILISIFENLKNDKFDVRVDTIDDKSGTKRKFEAIQEKHVNSNSNISKKQKLANGQHFVTHHLNGIKNPKSNKKINEKIFQVIRCIGDMFDIIMSEGSIEALVKIFGLLKDIVVYLDQGTSNTLPSFVKNQFKNWIEKPKFFERFQVHFSENDAIYFGLKEVSNNWKFEPISSITNRNKNELEGLKTVIDKRKDLLNFLCANDGPT